MMYDKMNTGTRRVTFGERENRPREVLFYLLRNNLDRLRIIIRSSIQKARCSSASGFSYSKYFMVKHSWVLLNIYFIILF